MRDDNKKATRIIHTSQSYDKKNKRQYESRRQNLYRDIFLLEEKEEDSSEEEVKSEINIIILYNKEKISLKFSQNRSFEDLIKMLEKKYFRAGFRDNYKIYYENKEIPMNDKRKLNKIVKLNDKNDNEVKFVLRSLKKQFLYSKMKRIYIQLENIPSFMDLSEQINNFIKSQKGEEINYDINYKDNSCSILFSSQEIAFSFVAYITNIKFTNKYYRKLKIDLKYNPLITNSNKKNQLRFLSEESKINSINRTIESLPSDNIPNPSLGRYNMKTYKSHNKMKNKLYYYENTYENDYYEDNFKSIQDSSPYGYEKELEKQKKIKDKKNWVGKKDFFTSINKKSFNKLIRPKNKLFLKRININEFNGRNSNININEKHKELNIHDNKGIKFRFSEN